MTDTSTDSGGVRESFQLPPSHEQAQQERATDLEGNWTDTSAGLAAAANALAEAREAAQGRPPPPPASDIVSGVPGEPQVVTLEGDPSKPISARRAAESLSALHAAQEQEIAQYEAAFANAGVSWQDVLDGKVPMPGAAEAPAAAQPQTSAELETARQQAAAAQAEAEQQRQLYESERLQRQAFDQMNDQVRHQRYLLMGAAQEVQRLFPDIVTQQDLQNAWVKNPQRAAEFTRLGNALESKALEAEALERRAQDVGRQANKSEAKRQDDLFLAAHPEYDDAKQAPALQRAALTSLKSAGFAEEELTRAWQGEAPLHLRDHRVQSFIADHTRLQQENALLKAQLGQGRTNGRSAPARLPPPVQAPGVAGSPTRGLESDIRALERQLAQPHTQNEGARLGMQLLQARRAVANRGY
jgi:hypothetical protein